MEARLLGGAALFVEILLGRRLLWRAGRFLYQYARRDGRNDPVTNGEYALHHHLTRIARAQNRPLRVIDIGANVGYWSLNLLAACRAAGVDDVHLWAFEPSPEIRACLLDGLKATPSSYRVDVYGEAVADASGRAAFDGGSAIVGTKRLVTVPMDAQRDAPAIEVPVTTLADFFAREAIAEVDFVKSDVEGFDLKVLQGAVPLLRDGRIGLLQFEYNHRWVTTRCFLKDVFDLVADLPYRVCKVVPSGLDGYPAWHPELETFFEANFALVRADLMGQLGVREGRFDAYNAYAAP